MLPLIAGNLNEIVADYADDAFIITPLDIGRGKEGIRTAFMRLLGDVPNADWELRTQVYCGDILFTEWSADNTASFIDSGTGTYMFSRGLIRAQTFHYKAHLKGPAST